MDANTLYVSDLDGTLLNTRDAINPRSLRIINSLIEKGMKFTYATARSLSSASVVTKGLSLHIPVIIYNGAFIRASDTGKTLYSVGFSKEEQRFMEEFLRKEGLSPLVYTFREGEEKVLREVSRENQGIRRYLSKRKGDRRMEAVRNGESIYQGDIFYFTCIGEREELEGAYRRLSEDKRFRATLQQELYRPEYWLEIMPERTSNAAAICELGKLWNCERIVSFGDSANDIPMFSVSDEAYAVENAVEELKSHATGIIPSNDNDGVAEFLQKRFCEDGL